MRAAEPARVVKIDWSELLGAVLIHVDTGEEIALELPRYSPTDQLDGRRVLYLDQNHWSRIARAVRNISIVSLAEARAPRTTRSTSRI
jgi:hypothetical protein